MQKPCLIAVLSIKCRIFPFNSDTIPLKSVVQSIGRGILMIEVKLSRILGEKRWSQSELAQRADVRPNTISDLYNDFADRVSLEQLDRICDALECDLADILFYTPNTEKIRKKRYSKKPGGSDG